MKEYSAFLKAPTLLDGLVSYPGHMLAGVFYPSTEMQSVYSKAQAD